MAEGEEEKDGGIHFNHQQEMGGEEEKSGEESSLDNFHDEADDGIDEGERGSDDESDFGDDDEEVISGRQRQAASNRRFIPIEFAKQHILKIEEDMKKMHERHVKLMREMDENYRLIE